MTIIAFDAAAFRVLFPAFVNSTTYPDATLQAYWDTAVLYISATNYGYLNGTARTRAINLLTAHIAKLADALALGLDQELPSAHKIGGGVSVTLVPPPTQSQFQWWGNLTEYGTQMLALLSVRGAGGMYFAGNRALR